MQDLNTKLWRKTPCKLHAYVSELTPDLSERNIKRDSSAEERAGVRVS